jgi:hypothetical protein
VLLILSYSILTGLECLLGAATVRIESIRLASEPPHPQPIFINIQSFLTRYACPTKLNAMLLSLAAVTGLVLDLSQGPLRLYSSRLPSSSPLDSRIDHNLASLVNTICFGIGSSQQRLHHSHYRIRAPLPSRGLYSTVLWRRFLRGASTSRFDSKMISLTAGSYTKKDVA